MHICGEQMREKEKWNGLSVTKTDRTGDARRERNGLLREATPPPEAMEKSQPLLLLSVMWSKATEWLDLVVMSVAHITTRDLEDFSSLGSCLGPRLDVQRLCRTGPAPHRHQHFGVACPGPHLCSTVEMDLMVMVSWPEGVSEGEMVPSLICREM